MAPVAVYPGGRGLGGLGTEEGQGGRPDEKGRGFFALLGALGLGFSGAGGGCGRASEGGEHCRGFQGVGVSEYLCPGGVRFARVVPDC